MLEYSLDIMRAKNSSWLAWAAVKYITAHKGCNENVEWIYNETALGLEWQPSEWNESPWNWDQAQLNQCTAKEPQQKHKPKRKAQQKPCETSESKQNLNKGSTFADPKEAISIHKNPSESRVNVAAQDQVNQC